MYFFVGDYSEDVGLGHFFRLFAIHQALDENSESTFLLPRLCTTIQHYIDQYSLNVIQCEINSIQQVACFITTELRSLSSNDWLIIDNYNLQSATQKKAPLTCKTFLISDEPTISRTNASITHYHSHSDNNKVQLSENETIIAGPRYRLLRPEFAHSPPLKIKENIRHILIAIGATDPENTNWTVANTILTHYPESEITIVTGGGNKNIKELKSHCLKNKVNLRIDPNNIPALIKICDIFVSAAGTMLWEAATQGVPMIVIETHHLQSAIIEKLVEDDAVISAGIEDTLAPTAVFKAFKEIESQRRRRELSRNIRKFCDGNGAHRVAKLIQNDTGQNIAYKTINLSSVKKNIEDCDGNK